MINTQRKEESEECMLNDRDISFGDASLIEGNEQIKAKARARLEESIALVQSEIHLIVII